jgi:hypothetical protein
VLFPSADDKLKAMEETKKGIVRITGSSPMEVSALLEASDQEIDPVTQVLLDAVGTTLSAYVSAAKELLGGRYNHLRQLVPTYLSAPGNVLASCCPDGVAIRFESGDQGKVIAAWTPDPLATIVPLLSQGLVQFSAKGDDVDHNHELGLTLAINAQNPAEPNPRTIATARVVFEVDRPDPSSLPTRTDVPFCLLSVQNRLDVELHLQPSGADTARERVLVRAPVRMPVGWECFEVYPDLNLANWKPETATLRAEKDILAAVVAQQLHEDHYKTLDPKADARRELGALLQRYKDLLDSEPEREETFKRFFRRKSSPALPNPCQKMAETSLGTAQDRLRFSRSLRGVYSRRTGTLHAQALPERWPSFQRAQSRTRANRRLEEIFGRQPVHGPTRIWSSRHFDKPAVTHCDWAVQILDRE